MLFSTFIVQLELESLSPPQEANLVQLREREREREMREREREREERERERERARERESERERGGGERDLKDNTQETYSDLQHCQIV